eukprot:CAMPEP_0181296234 /NCGR_PEP_ID=MMETSP1101-20121128/4588_1 /TAXON_ID=46948 /ORGANISM="Rhodomonas abbreviata, Strain Caron Lab Isolate" /LENGTH=787 /DNA_ID=CAMNT_0023401071 /DNA_START=45 /DNA_END=2408 /DNA_ORIENTATION=+
MPLNELIPIINQLQEAFAPCAIGPIDLPQIAVVGSQSSGKSSVLESIVGYDFLPRGTGIVTRRPLILQLINEDVEQDFAEFTHLSKRMFSFEDVKNTIQSETDKVAGGGKAVSPEPIILKVHSKKVVNLTLVDLPGLTKVPMGDQPQDISEVIRRMVIDVIKEKNCIILAVTAANQDIANSDGLQMAREVDPNGERTIGVLTKLDLMDKGTDARDILEGKVYPLLHGYVGVVNRSQKDIETKKSMKAAFQYEKEFLSGHPAYAHLAQKQGTLFLSRRLNAILEDHIRGCMPGISAKIKDKLREAQEKLHQYGDDDLQTEQQQRASVLNAITRFCQRFAEFMEGRSINRDQAVIYGPARMRDIFTVEFRQSVHGMDTRQMMTDEQIHTVRRNAVGVRADLFVPNAAFETLVKQLIQQLEEPAAACVRTVSEELKQFLREVLDKTNEIGRFEELSDRVWKECIDLLSERTRAAAEFVQNLINMEVAYINTDNPEFEKIRTGVYRLMAAHQGMNANQGSAQDLLAQQAAAKAQKPDPREARRDGTIKVFCRDQWKPHYVKVENKTLHLFVSQQDSSPVRSVSLEGCAVKTVDGEDARSTNIEISLQKSWLGARETVQLGCETAEDAATWTTILKREINPPSEGADQDPGIGQPFNMEKNGAGRGGTGPVRLSTDSLSLNRRTTLMPRAKVTALSDREVLEANVLRQLLEHYFRIVRASVLDSVPKAIMLMMVNNIQENLHERLMQQIYLSKDDASFPDLTRESEDVRLKRAEARQLVQCLRKAIEVMRKL